MIKIFSYNKNKLKEISVEEMEKNSKGILWIDFESPTKSEINSSQRKKIESIGLAISSVFGDIFTAAGSYKSVINTAGLDFVIYIEPAKKSNQQ